MNWKQAVSAAGGEQVSANVCDVVAGQGDVAYPNRVEGILTVNLSAGVPPQSSDEFIEDVLVAALPETGYDELESFRWYDARDPDDPSPWATTAQAQERDDTAHAVQVAKQRGVVAYPTTVFGTVEALVRVDVPTNWSETELKWTCIGRLLRDGPDAVLDVTWTDATPSWSDRPHTS